MRTSTKIAAPYVIQEPIHFLKEEDMLMTIRTSDSWDDTNTDPAKGILSGVLMGSLLWLAVLLLVDVSRG